MRLPQWLRPRPSAATELAFIRAAELAFIRRWAAVLVPLWGLAGLAAWVLPDSTYRATRPWTTVGMGIAIFCCCVLPYDYVRLRRTGGLYLIGFVIYLLTHNLRWWGLGQ